MRHLMIFIVRLWVDAQAEPLIWEGQVESVSDGARGHISGLEDLGRFIEVQTTRRSLALEQEECRPCSVLDTP